MIRGVTERASCTHVATERRALLSGGMFYLVETMFGMCKIGERETEGTMPCQSREMEFPLVSDESDSKISVESLKNLFLKEKECWSYRLVLTILL